MQVKSNFSRVKGCLSNYFNDKKYNDAVTYEKTVQHKCGHIFKIGTLATLTFLMVGCTTTQNSHLDATLTPWGAVFVTPQPKPNQSSIVIFRKSNAYSSNAVATYIDNRYVTSIKPGGYIVVDVCPTQHQLQLAGDATLRLTPYVVQNINPNAQQVLYFELIEGNLSTPNLVTRDGIESTLSLKKQMQHISRYNSGSCNASTLSNGDLHVEQLVMFTPQSAVVSTEQQNLLNSYIKKLKTYKSIAKITVTGYQDASEQSNISNIAQQRAQAVKNGLLKELPSDTFIDVNTKPNALPCGDLNPQGFCQSTMRRVEIKADGNP